MTGTNTNAATTNTTATATNTTTNTTTATTTTNTTTNNNNNFENQTRLFLICRSTTIILINLFIFTKKRTTKSQMKTRDNHILYVVEPQCIIYTLLPRNLYPPPGKIAVAPI